MIFTRFGSQKVMHLTQYKHFGLPQRMPEKNDYSESCAVDSAQYSRNF